MEKKIQTSVLISEQFYTLCKQCGIQFSEAMRVGISIMLSERGFSEYDNKLNITRKMNFFRDQAEKAMQKLNELGIKLDETKESS